MCSGMTAWVITTLNSSHQPRLSAAVGFTCERFSLVVQALITQLFPLRYLHIKVKLHVELLSLLRSDRCGPKGAPQASAPWRAPCYSLTSPTGVPVLLDHGSPEPRAGKTSVPASNVQHKRVGFLVPPFLLQ